MDRRLFLTSAAASTSIFAGGAFAAPARHAAKMVGDAAQGDAALNALFDRIFNETVATHPTYATYLGLTRAPTRA